MTVDLQSGLLLGVFGLAAGSFLNVCIHRLPRGESVVRPGSRCPVCRTAIRWFDNVPLLSWIGLRGRCRQCRTPIPAVYPLVELVTALLFVAQGWQLGWQWLLLPRLVLMASLVVLFMIDLEHRILPNRITLPGIAAGFVFSLALPPGWLDSLLGILLGGGTLFALGEAYYRWRGEEGLGMGDVKMLAMIGAFLGWQLVVVTLVLSSLGGSIVGIGMMLFGGRDLRYALPFGTFLALGAVTAALAGDAIVAWYLAFYLPP